MARPRRSEHTRAQLLELGANLFLEKGYNGAGIKEILDTAGVPKGSFYNYFESKEHYAAEVIRHYTESRAEQIVSYINDTDDAPIVVIENLQAMIVEIAEECGCGQGCLMGSMAGEIAGSSDLCRQAMSDGCEQWQAGFLELFKAAQASGDLRTDMSADVLVNLFWNQWQGALLKMQIDGNTDALRNSFADFMSLIKA